MYLDHDKSIDNAEWIVLVTLKSYSEETHTYVLKVQEYIKGSGPETISVESYGSGSSSPQSTRPVQTNFFGHQNSNFWTFGGSYVNGTDCKIHPNFKYGGNQYLVFGPKDYNVGFENVALGDDAWLSYVRKYVDGKDPKKPLIRSWKRYFTNAAAVIRVRSNWEENRPVWSQEILKGDELDYLRMLYISPFNYFDEYLDPNCIPYGAKKNVNSSIDRLVVFEHLPKNEIVMGQHLECVGAERNNSANIRSHGIYSDTAHRSYDIKNGSVNFNNFQFYRGFDIFDWPQHEEIKLKKIEALFEK